MKVLHVIPSIAAVRGGPSRAVVEMVQALRDCGVDAEIATTNDNGDRLLEVPLQQRSTYQQVPVWFFDRFSPAVHAVREFAFSRSLTAWLWQHSCDYDLLHVHAVFSYPSTAAMAIARHHQVPYVVRPLGQLCEWSMQQSAAKKQLYLRLIEKSNLNHSQALHFTTHQEQHEAAPLNLAAPSFVLPHGLSVPAPLPNARDRLRQQLGLPHDQPIVLFLSRIHPKKGLDFLIPALGRLRHHRFTFVLAGSGAPEHEQEADRLIAEHGLGDRTHRSGFVSGGEKDLLVQGADLFTLTSHSENFGIALLEALAAGLPVVTTPEVALASVVAEHQLGEVPPLDIGAIADAIDRSLTNLETLRMRGDRARQVVLNHYTWQSIAQRLAKVYAQSISSSV